MQRFLAAILTSALVLAAVPFVHAQYQGNEYHYQFRPSSASSMTAVPRGTRHSVSSSAAHGMHASASASLRQLWLEQAVWLREYAVSMTIGNPAVAAQSDRLLEGNREMSAAFAARYGAGTGDRLNALLDEHLAIATRRMEAAGAGDEAAFTAADDAWRANADAIALHLAQADPAWSQAVLRSLLQQRMDLLTQVAIARLQNDWSADIRTFDALVDNARALGDVMQPEHASSSSLSSSTTSSSGLFGPASSSQSRMDAGY